MKNIFFCYSILFIFSSTSCEKEELSKPPFYEVIEGNWKLGSDYTINGNLFQFQEYDLNGTIIKFDQGEMQSVWNCGDVMVIDESTEESFMAIKNENGLIYKSSVFLSDLPKLMSLKPGDGRSKFENDKWTTLGFPNTHVIFKEEVCKKYCDLGGSGEYDRRDCVDNLQNHAQIDQVAYFSRYNFEWEERERFKIESISASELELTFFTYFYNRVINGKLVFDEVKFKILRLNSSDIITVPPFHPDNYSYSWWQNFNAAINGLVLNGTAETNPNGIDNGCISFSDENSFVGWNRKPYSPMTLSFWVKPNTLSRPKQVIYSKYKNIYGPFLMSLELDKFVVEINDGFGNLQKVGSSNSLLNSEWNHICLTVDQNNFATLFINGNIDSNGTINSFNYDADGEILLGTAEEAIDNGLDVNLRGYLDEFIFFNKVFGEGEVKQLYTWHLTN